MSIADGSCRPVRSARKSSASPTRYEPSGVTISRMGLDAISAVTEKLEPRPTFETRACRVTVSAVGITTDVWDSFRASQQASLPASAGS